MEINTMSLREMPSVSEGLHSSHRLTAALGLESERGKLRHYIARGTRASTDRWSHKENNLANTLTQDSRSSLV